MDDGLNGICHCKRELIEYLFYIKFTKFYTIYDFIVVAMDTYQCKHIEPMSREHLVRHLS